KISPVVGHPFQGWLPNLKLVRQPPVQLLEAFSSSAILAITGLCAGAGAGGAGDVGGAAPVFTTGACLGGVTPGPGLCGRATCLGACTVMLGSWLVGPVAVCDIAVPLSNAVDRIATAEGATRLDDILIPRSPNPGTNAAPVRTPYHLSNQYFRRQITDGVQLSAIEPRYACATCFDSLR